MPWKIPSLGDQAQSTCVARIFRLMMISPPKLKQTKTTSADIVMETFMHFCFPDGSGKITMVSVRSTSKNWFIISSVLSTNQNPDCMCRLFWSRGHECFRMQAHVICVCMRVCLVTFVHVTMNMSEQQSTSCLHCFLKRENLAVT